MFGSSAPAPTSTPAPVADPTPDPQVEEARRRAQVEASSGRSRSGNNLTTNRVTGLARARNTLLTGVTGVQSQAPVQRKSLLGA